MEQFLLPAFWLAAGQVTMVDIILGSDNAIIIAMACRSLPVRLRMRAIVWGMIGAILLRVALTLFAVQILAIPFLKAIGAVLLGWIGVRLMAPEDDGNKSRIDGGERFWGAVRTVVLADLVMSTDNVLAIAAVAHGAAQEHQMPIVALGLLVSIPVIMFGSRFALAMMNRYPIIVTGGGLLLGWIAGVMVATDPALARMIPDEAAARYAFGAAGALLVVAVGRLMAKRAMRPRVGQ